MDSTRTQIADFSRVTLSKHMLHAKVPLYRIRVLLVHNHVVCSREPLTGQPSSDAVIDAILSPGRGRKQQQTAGTRRNATVLQEVGSIRVNVGINSSAQLRRQRQDADVVIEHIIGHAESSADRSVAAVAR